MGKKCFEKTEASCAGCRSFSECYPKTTESKCEFESDGQCIDGICINPHSSSTNTAKCCKLCGLIECQHACDQSGKAAPKAQIRMQSSEPGGRI